MSALSRKRPTILSLPHVAKGQTQTSRGSKGRPKINLRVRWNRQSEEAFKPQNLRHVPRGLEHFTANSEVLRRHPPRDAGDTAWHNYLNLARKGPN
jgi:hypothetical protein